MNCLVVYGKSAWKVICWTTCANHKILLSKISAPFEKRSAHYVIFILATTVLPIRLFDIWCQFESTGSINNQPTPRRRNARSAENIAAVRESVRENSRWSISRRSQELGLSATSTWRILRRDLGLHPYKIQVTQELKVNGTIDNAMCSLIGFWSNWKLTQISPNKSSLAMGPIFGWMDMWTSKIVEFGTIPIHARYTSSKYISRKSLFGADFGLAESSVHFFQNEASVVINCQRRALQIDDKQLLVT